MSERILLILEGEKTEPQIFDNLQRVFFLESRGKIFYVSYKNNIYNLWKEMRKDSYIDLIELLKEKNEQDELIQTLDRDKISQIYLFFDYDGHDSVASDDDLAAMISFFGEETEGGKLYISYPMIEAIKDLNLDFYNCYKHCKAQAKKNINYKQLVSTRTSFSNFSKLTLEHWEIIITHAIKRANCLLFHVFLVPDKINMENFSQAEIFSAQRNNHLSHTDECVILSALPFFVLEYFGSENICEKFRK